MKSESLRPFVMKKMRGKVMRNLIEILQAGSRYVSDLSKSEGKTMGKRTGKN